MSHIYLLIMIIANLGSGAGAISIKQKFPSNDTCMQVMQDIDSQVKNNSESNKIVSQNCYNIQSNNN